MSAMNVAPSTPHAPRVSTAIGVKERPGLSEAYFFYFFSSAIFAAAPGSDHVRLLLLFILITIYWNRKTKNKIFHKSKGVLQRAERERGQELLGTGSGRRVCDGDRIVYSDSDAQPRKKKNYYYYYQVAL